MAADDVADEERAPLEYPKLPEGAPNYVYRWSTELWCSTFFPKGRLHQTAAEGGRWLRMDGGQTVMGRRIVAATVAVGGVLAVTGGCSRTPMLVPSQIGGVPTNDDAAAAAAAAEIGGNLQTKIQLPTALYDEKLFLVDDDNHEVKMIPFSFTVGENGRQAEMIPFSFLVDDYGLLRQETVPTAEKR
ncbi:hypothetical protein ACLOJK_012723 [Asimina triloba]